MATLKLAVVPAKVLKNGTHKIRVAVGHSRSINFLRGTEPYMVSHGYNYIPVTKRSDFRLSYETCNALQRW